MFSTFKERRAIRSAGLALFAALIASACSGADESGGASLPEGGQQYTDEGWLTLFDGAAPADMEVWIARQGLFAFDEQDIFTVTDDGLIQVLGPEPNTIEDALLMTKESYENYRFRVTYKWGEAHFNRRMFPRNSGFLYHVFGGPGADDPADTTIKRYRSAAELGNPDGDDYGGWIRSVEYQMRMGEAGQGLMIGSQAISTLNAEGYYAPSPEGDILAVKGAIYGAPPIFEIETSFDSATEWNVAEIIVEGANARHLINGEEVLVLHDIRTLDPETQFHVPLTSGRVGVQAEGAELYIRSIELLPL
ncbi:MAG: DUF1080 domain-containing protein [Pseudomonadota bacterium]